MKLENIFLLCEHGKHFAQLWIKNFLMKTIVLNFIQFPGIPNLIYFQILFFPPSIATCFLPINVASMYHINFNFWPLRFNKIIMKHSFSNKYITFSCYRWHVVDENVNWLSLILLCEMSNGMKIDWFSTYLNSYYLPLRCCCCCSL